MAVLYTLCAGLLTFDNGPATYVGNHYFSAWAGFFISFAVFGSVLKEFLGVGGTSPAAAAETGGKLLKGDRALCLCAWLFKLIIHFVFTLSPFKQEMMWKWIGYK